MAVADYDREADALYVRLVADAGVARTIEVDDYRILDLDEHGQVVGLEVLYPAANLTIAPIARKYGFADQLDEIDRAVGETLVSPVETSVTVAIAYVFPVAERPFADVAVQRSAGATGPGVLTTAA
jgi:uncharacterized protein YuzE